MALTPLIDERRWVPIANPSTTYRRLSLSSEGYACGHEAPAGTGTRRMLRPARGEARLGRRDGGSDEVARRPPATDDGLFALEDRRTDLRLRLHGRPRVEPADNLPPHGEVEGGGPRRLRETRHLGVLQAPRQAQPLAAKAIGTIDLHVVRFAGCRASGCSRPWPSHCQPAADRRRPPRTAQLRHRPSRRPAPPRRAQRRRAQAHRLAPRLLSTAQSRCPPVTTS